MKTVDFNNVRPDTRLHVALVTETYPPEINGVAMTLHLMVQGLLQRGHRVQLIRPRQSIADIPAQTPQFAELLCRGMTLPRYESLKFGLPSKSLLRRAWTQQRPDIVHVATEGPLGWSAISAASSLGLPVTSDLHTNFDSYSRHYGVGWLQEAVKSYLRRFHNRTATTFVPTSRMAEDLRNQGYRSVQVVSRGVDTTLFSPRKRSPELRAAWGLEGKLRDAPALISVGRLAPEKNLPLVLRAYRQVRTIRSSARLVIVGDGPMRDAVARECPEAIMCGVRRGEDLATHYASADLFLFPSLTETFGNVTLEAMASALCPVAYDCAAAAEVIRSHHNGFVAPPGDEDDFIRRVALAALEDAFRNQMAFAARHTAERHGWEQVNDAFAAALASVAAVAASPAQAGITREDIQVAGSP